jgi:surface antigen
LTSIANIEVFGRTTRSIAFWFATAAVCLSMFVSGCAVNGNSIPEVASADTLITGSVTEQVQPDGVAKSDSDVIKSAVAANSNASSSSPVAWNNQETGSSGAIVSIEGFTGKHGQNCKGFKTSVSNFAGISFYNGETCKVTDGEWVLSWFKIVS